MANRLKSRRYKKRQLSSKKRRQNKPRTKRYRRKTRKTRGGMKRGAPSTPTQEYIQLDEPLAPRKSNTRQMNEDGNNPIGVNLFGEGFQGNQENINQDIPMVTPPQTPMQAVQTPVFTPIQFIGPPQTPVQELVNNNDIVEVTPEGNLNDAMEDAYMESITTPYGPRIYNDATIHMYDEDTEEDD
jgi:hypothetical protein